MNRGAAGSSLPWKRWVAGLAGIVAGVLIAPGFPHPLAGRSTARDQSGDPGLLHGDILRFEGVEYSSLIDRTGAVEEPDCGAVTGGAIRGSVVNDSTGEPVAGAWVRAFVGRLCLTTTDEAGQFVLERVQPGTVRIHAGGPEYRPLPSVEVSVREGDTTSIELALVPGGPIADCRAIAECASILDGGPDAPLGDPLERRFAALATAIALAWHKETRRARWYACVLDEPEQVLVALRERYDLVVPGPECEFLDAASGQPPRSRKHRATSAPAFEPSIGSVRSLGPGRLAVSLWVYIGPRWAAMWDCRFVRIDRWRVTGCELVGRA